MDDSRYLLQLLGDSPMTPTALARRAYLSEERTLDLLAELEDLGRVATCDSDDGIVVARIAQDAPAPATTRDWPGPVRRDGRGYPYPTSLIGGSLTNWDAIKHDVCTGCGGRRLKPWEYCLCCDRWGLTEAKPHISVDIKAA